MKLGIQTGDSCCNLLFWKTGTLCYDPLMSNEFNRLVKALTEAEPSVKQVRSAFVKLGASIEKRGEEVHLRQQAIKEDSKRGARLTKHRFSL